MVRSTFLRLWVRAPRTTMLFLASRVGGIYKGALLGKP
jgi:hypothetical protein